MPRKAELTPTFSSSASRWVLNIPPALSSSGKRAREFFEHEADAKSRAREITNSITSKGRIAKGATADLIRSAIYWDQTFQFMGFSGLEEACREFEKRVADERRSPTLAMLVEAYLVDYPKAKDDWSRLEGAFGHLWPSRVGTMDVDFWRDELAAVARKRSWGPRTYNEALLWFGSLYRHALAHGKVERNPIEAIRNKAIPSREVAVLEPEQLEEILARCLVIDRPMSLYFAVLAFGGLRPVCEFERDGIRWDGVLWDQGLLRVIDSKNRDKTGAVNRYVTINPTLRSWLEEFRQVPGSAQLCPVGFRRRRGRILMRGDGTKVADWSAGDIARHSFGSYLAATPGVTADTVRSEMGHTDTKTFFRHYRNARTPEQAAKYWALTYQKVAESIA